MAETLRPRGALAANEARARFRGMAAMIGLALLALMAGGGWAYARVHDSLKEIRLAGLSTLLEAQVGGMVVWIEEKKRDAERWGSTPEVQRAARDLVRMAESGQAPQALCDSAPQRALMAEIAPYAVLEETVAINLKLRSGAIIAANRGEYCGEAVVSKEFLDRLAPVFEARTVFIRPFDESERVPGVRLAIARPLVWVETPVRDDAGKVVAALGFARYADERFGKLIASSASPATREAFAFDARGFMLTESRHVESSRASGMLKPGESAILRLQVREPGGDRPYTQLMEAALFSRSTSDAPVQGAVLEPYRDYRGVEVIGAWRWLPEKEMGIAAEIEVGEAFAPLRYLQLAFGGLSLFLLLAMATAAAASLWTVRLQLREARRMGEYTLLRPIAEGGMSRIYLARHTHLKRPAAIKVLKSAIASDEVVTRFEREVQLCSQLTHPNTIEIYDYGRTRDGEFYYAMEYLEGISLEEVVARHGPLPLARAIHALRQACGSLKEAHQRGLVHRDVKPHNLMLCVRGGEHDVVKVLDFGLVKEMGSDTRDITQFAKVLGTPLYMAPERLRNPADADPRADIYALGAVAYLILTGKRVFAAGSDHDLVYNILNNPAPSLADGGIDAPGPLERLVARCLAKDREARPADIDEVTATLDPLAREHPWSRQEARAWWQAHSGEARPAT